MPQYNVTFQVPATVMVTVRVEEPNIQDALISAHDKVKVAKPSPSDVVVSLSAEDAELADVQRLEESVQIPQVDPPSPLQGRSDFRVWLFAGNNESSNRIQEVTGLTYEKAVSVADCVKNTGSPAGFAQVVSFDKNVQYEITAPRGGWEVSASPKNPREHDVRFLTWLDEQQAHQKALELFVTGRYAQVNVVDFTDRMHAVITKSLKANTR